MFDDVDHIEDMTYQEYKQVVYYLNHPAEYEGDYISFRDKVVEFASRKDVPYLGYTKHKKGCRD